MGRDSRLLMKYTSGYFVTGRHVVKKSEVDHAWIDWHRAFPSSCVRIIPWSAAGGSDDFHSSGHAQGQLRGIGRPDAPRVVKGSFPGRRGGLKHGQVIGASERDGGQIRERPVTPGDLAATIYRHMGVPLDATYTDEKGRPVCIVDQGEPIRELF